MAMLNPTHPGETIRMAIEETGWSVTTAAKRLGVSKNTLHRLLAGTGRINCNENRNLFLRRRVLNG